MSTQPNAPAYKTIHHCRACGSDDLVDLFSLGTQAVSNFVRAGDPVAYCPIELVMCRACTLVQQRHTAPQELLYSGHYWYRSGVTDSMRVALADVVHSVETMTALERGDVVLDIGSNDGTLLRSYSDPGVRTVGFEPASNLAAEGSVGIDTLVNDFWSAEAFLDETDGRRARAVTACGMFYDLDDPNRFIRDVARALDPNGLFVAQLMCLRQTVDRRDVGNLCHEHLEFYSLCSLRTMLARYGLEVFRLEANAINGGSYRLYAQHREHRPFGPPHPSVAMAETQEVRDGLHDPLYYQHWLAMVNWNRQNCLNVINAALDAGHKVWVYGASTKGNVVLQYYGLSGEVIEAAADRSPEKWGRYTAGSNVLITSEEEFRKADPHYALVLPYAFKDEFVRREHEWLARGGRFLFPLPELTVVGGPA